MDIQEQRVRFVVAASREGKSLTALCQEFGISPADRHVVEAALPARWTVGDRGTEPQTAAQSVAHGGGVGAALVEVRRRYPDWGARKLQVLLAREGTQLTRSTVHRILLRHDLVPESQRRRQALQRFERGAPNELWQMDFKSPKGWNAPVGPLSVLDDHSRSLLVLQAVWSTRAELVREQLEGAFASCGVPQAMLMDHGIPWWRTLAPSGMTGLTLWLMKQGIELHWSGRRHPQGKVERFHGELERALHARNAPRKEPQAWLDQFRWEHSASTRSTGDEHAGAALAEERAPLRPASATLAVSSGSVGAQGRLLRQAWY